MKTKLLVAALIAASILPTLAGDKPASKSLPLSTVAAMVEKHGYTINEVTHDKDVFSGDEWKMDAVKQGKHYELKVMAKTGKIADTDREGDDNEQPGQNMKLLSVIALELEKQGYLVSGVDFDHAKWRVEAHKDGKKWKLTVAPDTGNIISIKKD